ncbi:MAG TPA: hypothetical protein VK623_05295 [Flavobacterium sp.]|nr:hypothetical protein [Flavobacterium sp.]
MNKYLTVLLLALFCCHMNGQKPLVISADKFHKLEKLYITGDFDGDKKTDTLFQYNYSKLKKAEILNAPDPFKTEWDTVVNWFYKQESDVRLSLKKKGSNILHLGTAQGLNCLINVGDTNNDGKDEIALVVDYCDFSRVNSCKVFTLCNGKWTLVKRFGIHEGAFDWDADQKRPTFTNIRGFLEQENGVWKYSDYEQNDYETAGEVGKMIILKVDKCTSK